MSAAAFTAGDALETRMATTADLPFVFDSWLRSQWDADAKRKMLPDVFFPQQRGRIERILKRSMVVIAFSTAAPEEALGYVCFERIVGIPVVHWVYTKQALRRLGVARFLVQVAQGEADCLQHSHKSDARAKKLFSRFRSVFNPYAAEE